MNKHLIKKRVLKNIMCRNYNNKIMLKILNKIEEDRRKMFENLSTIKYKIKKEDIDNIDNWGKNKGKFLNLIKKKKEKKKLIIKATHKLDNILKNNNIFMNETNNLFIKTKNNINYKGIFTIYKNFCLYKIKNKNFNKQINTKKVVFININYKTNRTKLSMFKFNKCLLTLSNGIFLKKLGIEKKKYIKSEKLTFFLIKTINNVLKYNFNNHRVVINNVGVKSKLSNFINNISKKIKVNNISIINQPKINFNKYFKFKKIKSIKRKLKKKIIKMK